MMIKVKCPHCNHTLMHARVADCEIKCTRCKQIVKVIMKEKSEPHLE